MQYQQLWLFPYLCGLGFQIFFFYLQVLIPSFYKDTEPGAYCICPTGFNLDKNGKDCLPTKKMNDVVETIVQKHQAAARSEPKYAHCLALRPPKDGFIIETDCTSQDEKQLGHKCHFGCQQGFALQGSTILNCTPTGWSAAIPRCKKVELVKLRNLRDHRQHARDFNQLKA